MNKASRPLPGLITLIREDLTANRGYKKSQFVLAFFRVAQHLRDNWSGPAVLPARVVGFIYEVVVEWVIGIEIPLAARIGRRPRIYHGVGIVINGAVEIGDDVVLRHGVTIGNNGEGASVPLLGNGVDIGTGASILGSIAIGDHAKIGAHAVVTHDVPKGATAVGVPARLTGLAEPGSDSGDNHA